MNYMVELVWTASISCLFLFYFGEDISSIITKSCWLNQNVVGFLFGWCCFFLFYCSFVVVLVWMFPTKTFQCSGLSHSNTTFEGT